MRGKAQHDGHPFGGSKAGSIFRRLWTKVSQVM